MYLHWEGRKGYRTRMPAPRVLEPVPELSCGDSEGNRVIEGDNLQVMISLRSHYQGAIDVAYLDPPYNTGKKDFAYSDARFHDPNADGDDMVYVNNEDGGRHTKWLNYMGPRLWLVWQLLADDGHMLRCAVASTGTDPCLVVAITVPLRRTVEPYLASQGGAVAITVGPPPKLPKSCVGRRLRARALITDAIAHPNYPGTRGFRTVHHVTYQVVSP